MESTAGHIMVTEEIGTCMCKLPSELKPQRKYFGVDAQHTGALQIKMQGKVLYIPLDVEEIKIIEDGLARIKQQPLHDPAVIMIPTQAKGYEKPERN